MALWRRLRLSNCPAHGWGRDAAPAGDRVVITLDGKYLPYQW